MLFDLYSFVSRSTNASRQHPCISKFPNEEFYAGELRDGPRVHVSLEDVMPGLAEVLHGIIRKSYSTTGNSMSAQHYWNTSTDEKARHHYLEVDGTRRTGGDGTSMYVQEHIDVFFNHVFPALQEYFRDTTSKNLMIICAYSATVNLVPVQPKTIKFADVPTESEVP